jgi:hypothetical protein
LDLDWLSLAILRQGSWRNYYYHYRCAYYNNYHSYAYYDHYNRKPNNYYHNCCAYYDHYHNCRPVRYNPSSFRN